MSIIAIGLSFAMLEIGAERASAARDAARALDRRDYALLLSILLPLAPLCSAGKTAWRARPIECEQLSAEAHLAQCSRVCCIPFLSLPTQRESRLLVLASSSRGAGGGPAPPARPRNGSVMRVH